MEKIKDKLYDLFANYVDNKCNLLYDLTDIDELVDRTARYITRGFISIMLYQKRDRQNHKSDIEDEIFIHYSNKKFTDEDIEEIVSLYEEYLGEDTTWNVYCKKAIEDYLESKGE